MTPSHAARKKRFVAALVWAETTAHQWAKAEGVDPGELSHVLSGRRIRPVLEAKIDEFARKTLAKVRVA